MSFIPLDQEYRLKGKAASTESVPVSASPAARSAYCAVDDIRYRRREFPYVAVILIGVIAVWIYAVTSLGKQFSALVDGGKKVVAEEEKAPQVWPEVGGELKAAS